MKTELRLCAAIIGAGIPMFAQQVMPEIKARVPVDEALETVQANSAVDSQSPATAAFSGFHLPRRFSLQVDPIYRRLGYRYDDRRSEGSIYARQAANAWEIPVLLKIKLSSGRIRPFVGAGATMRLLSGIDPLRTAGRVAAQDTRTDRSDRSDLGASVGAGLDFKKGRLHITPQVRYTRWGSRNFVNPINAFLRSERNQGDFSVAFNF